MAKYRRVAYVDRCQIHALLQAEFGAKEISKRVGFHKSTIYRELARSGGRKKFHADQSEILHRKRIRSRRKEFKIQGELEAQVKKLLKIKLSPEQISGRLWLEQRKKLSHQAIYDYVRRNYSELKTTLRRFNKRGAGRYRMRQCRRENLTQLSIRERPKIVELRRRIGD